MKPRAWNSTLPASGPLRRHARLKRSWMKRRPPRRLDRETEAEKVHKRAIRSMGICAFRKYGGVGRCRGPLQAAHLGHSGGMGAKHGDWTTAALACDSHHAQWDGRQKPSVFDVLTADEREAMRDDLIHLAREFVAGRRTEAA